MFWVFFLTDDVLEKVIKHQNWINNAENSEIFPNFEHMNPKLTFLHVRIYQLETESVSFLMWKQVKNSVDHPDDAAGGREELEVAL